MEKKVGNYIVNRAVVATLLFSFWFTIILDASIMITMQDMNHKPIDQAMYQVPFILQVEVKNIFGFSDAHLMERIAGIEKFNASQSMMTQNVFIENGKKTTKFLYSFVLQADQKGIFTVGPLVLQDNTGKMITSNRLMISVGDDVVLSQQNQKDRYFMNVQVDKQKIYVGEKVTLKVSFYDSLSVDNLHIKFPDFNNVFIVKNKKNWNQSIEIIDQKEYNLTQWTFDMYPTDSGSLIIQGIQAAFFTPDKNDGFFLGGLTSFFNAFQKTEDYIVGKPVKIDVLPLPHDTKKHQTNLVGQLSEYTASINQDTASVGQGIILTTHLVGNANFETMDPLDLLLPQGWTCYDSPMVVVNEARNSKRVEYVVQAHAAGTYHIPSQTCIYFDPVDQQYKTIQSNSLDIVITPSAQEDQSLQQLHGDQNNSLENDEQVEKKIQDFNLIQTDMIHAKKNYTIPVMWYQLILWVLFLVWIFLGINRYFLYNFITYHPVWIRYRIFMQAKKACRYAQKHNQISALHEIFLQLFAQLINKTYGTINQEDILGYLAAQYFSQEDIQAWKKFNHDVLQASFSLNAQHNNQQLFVQSFEWIKRLKAKV